MDQETDFLTAVEAFLERHRMEPTAFGRGAINDPNFVFDLRDGRDVLGRTETKVRSWMAKADQRARAACPRGGARIGFMPAHMPPLAPQLCGRSPACRSDPAWPRPSHIGRASFRDRVGQ